MDGSEWSFDNLNSICWAIGAISGCLPEQDEKQFLIHTIKNLLTLCEQKKGKENKAVVASNIMYVVGQYPKFLRTNWNFLKTVVKKLFEFMRETFPGVQEMACNTFLTISKKCGREFVIKQTGPDNIEKEAYIFELIRNITEQIQILDDGLKLVYYECLSNMIKEEVNVTARQNLVQSLLKNQLELFGQVLMNVNGQGPDTLKDEKVQQFLVQFLKINQKIVFPVGYAYLPTLLQILKTLNDYYMYFSQQIHLQVQQQGKQVMNWYTIKRMRIVKKETLKLYASFFQYSSELELNQATTKDLIILPICALLQDYSNSIAEQKEPELLIVFKFMLEKAAQPVTELVPQILQSIFDSTITLISEDFNSYPDHRYNFFDFLKSCVNNHLSALFNMPAEQFKLMIDCIIWAFKHQVPNLQELGLDLMYFILQNLNSSIQVANSFYQLYYMRMLKDIIEILTDTLHTSGFKTQSQILQILFQVAASSQITVKFTQEQGNTSNLEYISQFLISSLSNAFQNVSKQQTEFHIVKMFNSINDTPSFRRELSDYLIQLKQYAGNNEHLLPNVVQQ